MIAGTFTDVVDTAKTYYEDRSGHVYSFRIQAGLCRANLRDVSHQGGRLTLVFDEIRGQPDQIRVGFDDGSWSDWRPFTPQLELATERKPQRYQLRSRLEVDSPTQRFPP